MKLCQVIAIEKGIKNKAKNALTEVYQKLQKADLLIGVTRVYTPKDDEGEQFPPEKKHVQLTVSVALKTVQVQLEELLNVTATKDWANCTARANLVVDGNVIISGVPVTYLLFLEKQLVDVHTLVSKLPTLDPSETWRFDESAAHYASESSITNKTKKTMKSFVKAPATDKHPAQVEVFTEDVVIGTWDTIKFSGAIPTTQQQMFLERIEKLQRAVKFAREEANATEVQEHKVAEPVLKFIFG